MVLLQEWKRSHIQHLSCANHCSRILHNLTYLLLTLTQWNWYFIISILWMGKLRHSEAVNLPQSLQLINSWTKVPPRLSCSKVNVINDHIMLPLPFLAPGQRLLKYWSKSTQLCLSVRRWNHIGWARKYLHEHLFVPSFSQKKPKPKEARWFAHGYTWLWANSGLLCSSQWFCHMTFQAFSPMGYITNSNFYSSFWMIPATCLIMSL